jgi:ribosomal subunit interface protein
MDIVVKGRNVEVPEHYRVLVTAKLSRLERYDRKLLHFDVELFHEPNRRQHKSCQRVEIATETGGEAADPTSVHTAADIPGPRLDDQYDTDHQPGRIVRNKEHSAKPMTIDQALYEMELVGHDFYLFADADSGQPAVVYRRKGFDYGVIRLT